MKKIFPTHTKSAWNLQPEDRLIPSWRHVIAMFAVIAIGTVVGIIGSFSLPIGENRSFFWPAMTIQAAGAIWFGGWGIFAGTLFPIFANLLTGGRITSVVGFIPANFIQSLCAAVLFRTTHADPRLKKPVDYLVFIGGAIFLGNALGALSGIGLLAFKGEITTLGSFTTQWFQWWFGNSLPAVIMGIPLMTVISPIVIHSSWFCKKYWGGSPSVKLRFMRFRDIPIAIKLLIGFGLAGIVPVLVIAFLSFRDYISLMKELSRYTGQQLWQISQGTPLRAIVINVSIFLSLICSGLFARSIQRPLARLSHGVDEIRKGNLGKKISVPGRDEIGKLATSFNAMSKSLLDYINKLKKVTAEKERTEHELRIAKKIQESFLPETIPQFPGFDIAAITKPARLVGGDFYDFIPVDENKTGLLIADISGKGIPAAIFMGSVHSLFRAEAMYNNDITEIIKKTNSLIAMDNRYTMFVTLFYLILDVRSRSFTYTNAGHNPPLLFHNSTGECSQIPAKNTVLGISEDMDVLSEKTSMRKGDILILYTDGLTESINNTHEQFGIERITDIIMENQNSSSDTILHLLLENVEQFSHSRTQFDDITIIILKCLGK